MSKTVHFVGGCPWASGGIQMADTMQTYIWEDVTCYHCQRLRYHGSQQQQRAFDREEKFCRVCGNWESQGHDEICQDLLEKYPEDFRSEEEYPLWTPPWGLKYSDRRKQ